MATTKIQPVPVVSPELAYDYLNRALLLLEKPSSYNNSPHSWIQGREAVRADGTGCAPESEQAVAWCTIGVVRAVTYYDQTSPDAAYKYILSLLNMANPIVFTKDSLPGVNDTHAFSTVQRMFEKAKVLAIKFGG